MALQKQIVFKIQCKTNKKINNFCTGPNIIKTRLGNQDFF